MARNVSGSKFNLFLFIERTKKEAKALNQLMFSGFYNTVFIVLPAYVSLIVYFFFRNSKISDSPSSLIVKDYQTEGLESFLISFKITLIFVASFLILYRWSINLKNGKYGYWLTLGIKREVLFLFVLTSVSLRLMLAFTIPFLFILIVSGIQLPISEIMLIFVLEFMSIVFMVAFSLFLAESIEISELAVSTLILVYAILFIVQGSILYYIRVIFLGEFEYDSDFTIVTLILGTLGTSVFAFVGYYLHKKHDIEL